jgi:TRAP-type mannitol/chloroaromatic compound transport system permease small subunit
MVDRDNQCRLVYISRENMALLTEISGATDDIITALFYLANPMCAIVLYFDFHEIAYSYGIGTTDATDAEIAFYTAFHIRTIVQTNDV